MVLLDRPKAGHLKSDPGDPAGPVTVWVRSRQDFQSVVVAETKPIGRMPRIPHIALHLRPVPALMVVAALLSACAAPQPLPLPLNPSPSGQAIVIRASGSGTALPLVRMLAEAYAGTHDGVTFDIREGTNSGGAIKGVVTGTLDLAVVNRTLSDDEVKQPLVYHRLRAMLSCSPFMNPIGY